MAPEAAILVDHVTKRFGSSGGAAVNDVSFAVAKSEFFSLLGPSGCGKTTTLRMIAGFETPTTGRIVIEGREASTIPAHPSPRPVPPNAGQAEFDTEIQRESPNRRVEVTINTNPQ